METWWTYDENFKEVVFFDKETSEVAKRPLLQHFRAWDMKLIEKKLGIYIILCIYIIHLISSFTLLRPHKFDKIVMKPSKN